MFDSVDQRLYVVTHNSYYTNYTLIPIVAVYQLDFPSARPSPIDSPLLMDVVQDQAFTYRITCPGASAFTAAPLPTGVTVDASTGIISGTPVQAGSYMIALTATTSAGTAQAALLVAVQQPGSVPPGGWASLLEASSAASGSGSGSGATSTGASTGTGTGTGSAAAGSSGSHRCGLGASAVLAISLALTVAARRRRGQRPCPVAGLRS